MLIVTGLLVLSLFAAANDVSDAPEGKYPYQISIWTNRTQYQCGGSIINERYILTAAHCFMSYNATELSIVAGTHLLIGAGTRYQAEKIIGHKGFNMNNVQDDIGLIRLTEKIVYTDKTQPIQLPTENFSKENYPVIISGWGKLYAGGPHPKWLQEIELKVISQEMCKQVFPVISKQIRTFTKKGQGVCNGDSGGPLVADGIQIGIVSYGQPCGAGLPDVYTRVYSYLDWIAENMEI